MRPCTLNKEQKEYESAAKRLLAENIASRRSNQKAEIENSRKQKTMSQTLHNIPKNTKCILDNFQSRINSMEGAKFDQSELHDLSILESIEDIQNVNVNFSKALSTYSKRKPKESMRASDLSDEQPMEQNESKRNFVYQHQSCKEGQNNEGDHKTIEAHNKIFEMIFAKKNALSETVSTRSSSSRRKFDNTRKMGVDIEDFNIGQKLGAGKFGQVYAARHIGMGFMCALKKIKKSDIDSRSLIQLIRQIKIQSFLNHPNITKLYGFFCDKNHVYLMMEYCASGDMYSFLKKNKRVSEPIVQNLIRQVSKAIEYMHDHTIIHRDLKPENILLHQGMAKICDFGWSISSTVNRETFCGTPLYVSPELLKRDNYNNKIDVWSIGILTYELLIGKVPFDIFTEGDLIKIVEDDIYFSKKVKISEDAKDVILNCLQKDPRDRLTVTEILEHPFLQNRPEAGSSNQTL